MIIVFELGVDMDNQRFNKAFVITLFFTIVFIVSLNYLIDPYDVFHIKNRFNINKPHADSNQRVSKVPALKLNREKIDAIWVGSSRTGWSSNVEYESSVLNANIKNLALNGCSFYEAITMAKNAIIIHPEIKTVYFGIDFSMMNGVAETLDATRPNTKPQLTKEESAVKKGDKVTLVGFGTFEARKRAARIGRNPQTGKELKIAAKTVPAFSAGKKFKEAVK